MCQKNFWDFLKKYDFIRNLLSVFKFFYLKIEKINYIINIRLIFKKFAKEQKGVEKIMKDFGSLKNIDLFILGDRAYLGLPEILEKQFQIKITEPLKRIYLYYYKNKKKQKILVHVFGKGIQNQEEILIIGDAKSRLKKRHIDNFISKFPIFDELFPEKKFYLMVTYMIDYDSVNYARSKGIEIFYSYQLAR